eukprot:jgi/Mesen1/2330/ME000155S01434
MWRTAVHLFDWMRSQADCQPDARCYATLLSLLGRHRQLPAAVALFDSMPPGSDASASTVVHNAMLSAFLSCNRLDRGLQLLHQMAARSVPPDAATYGTLIAATGPTRSASTTGMRLLRRMTRQGIAPTPPVIGALLKALCAEGCLAEAAEVLRTAEEACGGGRQEGRQDGRRLQDGPQDVQQAERQGKRLGGQDSWRQDRPEDAPRDEGQDRRQDGARGGQPGGAEGGGPNLIMYNTLIDALCHSGQVAEAEERVRELTGRGLQPSQATYVSLIRGHGKRGDYRAAEALLERARAEGAVTDGRPYTALMTAYAESARDEDAEGGACARANRVAKAERLFEEMQRSMESGDGSVGGGGGVEVHGALMDAYRRALDDARALQLWKYMLRRGVKPSRAIYNILLDHRRRAGFKPDRMVYNMLINAYGRGANSEGALLAVSEMRQAGMEPDSYTYTTLVFNFLRMRDFKHAIEYHDFMCATNNKPNDATYEKLAALVNEKKAIQTINDERAVRGKIVKRVIQRLYEDT